MSYLLILKINSELNSFTSQFTVNVGTLFCSSVCCSTLFGTVCLSEAAEKVLQHMTICSRLCGFCSYIPGIWFGNKSREDKAGTLPGIWFGNKSREDKAGTYLEYGLGTNSGRIKQVHYLEYGLETNPERVKRVY